jgi:hypothetical protein
MLKHLFSGAMLALVAICAAFGAGVGFLFHHMMAGAIIGAMLPLGATAIMVLVGLMFFSMAHRLFSSINRR